MNRILVLILIVGLLFGTLLGCDRVQQIVTTRDSDHLDVLVGESTEIYGVVDRKNNVGSLRVWSYLYDNNSYQYGLVVIKEQTNDFIPNDGDKVKVTGILKQAGGYYFEKAEVELVE